MNDSLEKSDIRKRHIRSYVRREGRMTVSQKRAMDVLWPRWGIDKKKQPVDIKELFGRSATTHLDVGFGSGDTLLAMASALPQDNFVGIEVYRNGVAQVLKNCEEQQLNNVRVICEDAVEALDHMLPAASMDRVYLYFPDPWHKKRHHKRRLVQTAFADRIARVLKPGGEWLIATDWQNYAEHMLEVLNPHPAFDNLSPTGDFVPRHTTRPLTRFERRGQRLGHDVFDFTYRRRDPE